MPPSTDSDLRQAAAHTLDEAGPLRVEARTLAQGWWLGTHHAPQRGESSLFREHAEYRAGDDPKRIDWKATARRPRPIVKRFDHDAQLTVCFVLDASVSMQFSGGAERTKAAYAALLIAALAEIVSHQQDRFALVTFNGNRATTLRADAGARHLERVYALLSVALNEERTGTPEEDALASFGGTDEHATTFVFSDFLDQGEQLLAKSRPLVRAGHSVVAVHTLSPEELTLPHQQPSRFVDPESGYEVATDPSLSRSEYLAAVERWRDELGRQARDAGIDFVSCNTASPPATTLRHVITSGLT